jgi:O-antigen ligase
LVEAKPGSPRRVRLHLGGKVIVFIFTVVAMSGITVVALAGAVANLRIASFSATAIVGVAAGLASWTLVALYGRVPTSAARVASAFAAFGIALLASALLGTVTRQGIQFIQVFVSALGALLLAAAVRRSLGDVLDARIGQCVRLTSMILIGAAVASAAGMNIDVSPRTSAIVALIGMGWFLAEYRNGRRHALLWAIATLVAVVLSLSRSALFAGFAILSVTLIAASPRHRLRNTVFAFLLLASGYAAITSWAPLHDRFFQGDVTLDVGGLKVNSEGRTHVWDVLWSEVPDDALFGHGPGAASARSFALDPAFDQPHNDYLRLLYDFGVVGCALLAWCAVRITRGLRRAKANGDLTLAARAAGLAGLAMLIVMITDNPLDYPFVMIPLGALIGVALGSAVSRGRVRAA